jgi:hypothetical protein
MVKKGTIYFLEAGKTTSWCAEQILRAWGPVLEPVSTWENH